MVDHKGTSMGKINPWKVTGYKQGQNVACRVNYAEKDGYAVTIQKDNLPGFIKTANVLKAGDEILGVFVCVHNGRILLSQLFSAPRATKHQLQQTTVNWEEHQSEEELNAAYEAQAATSRQMRMTAEGTQPGHPDFSQYQPAAATSEMPPINYMPPGGQQDYSQFQQPPQPAAYGYDQHGQPIQNVQQYQNPNQPQQQYDQYQQYQQPQQQVFEMPASPQPPLNPYQNPTQNQYDASQQPAWANPQATPQPDFSNQHQAAPQNQMVPYQQHPQTLQAQQQYQQQNQYAQPPQPGQYENGQQAQYESDQQGQYQQPNQGPYGQPQPAAYGQPPGGPSAYGQPPGGPSAYGQPPAGQGAYGQPPVQQEAAPQMQMQMPPQMQLDQQFQPTHSQVPTKRFRLRRAIDLVMPPVDNESLESLKSFKISDYDMEWLITDLEGGMRTGCIKATSEQKLSRSAALLYKGRAVGCIYGCKANPEAKPTEESLASMLADLEAPDAVVTLYDLPEDCALSMSALFLGYPIDNNPEMTSREYCDFVMNWFGENTSTACLAVTVAQTKSTYLVFVHKGKFCGAFFVEEQQFSREPGEIITMFNNHPDAKIEASILNADTLNSGMRFGYSLSMARQKRSGF